MSSSFSKARATLFALLLAIAAGVGGWYFGARQTAPASAISSRKVLFYQSPMHPWIKSDQPGNCTICGMKLVPVYEGDAPAADASATTVKLNPRSMSVITVESAPVERRPLDRVLRVAGKIEDDDSKHLRLSAYVEGRIDKLFVNYVGAEVTAGQPLAAFFSRELIVARGEYLEALKRGDASIDASRQKLLRMGLTAAQIEKLPAHKGETFDLIAPVTGTVVERKVYEGQYVKEGDVLFELADFSKMWFVFDAYERDLAWIRVGQSVEITTPSVPGRTFTAPIAFIDPNLMTDTRTAKVRVVLENPLTEDPATRRRTLLHKVYADGRIRVATEPVLTVPRSAVLSPGSEPIVYVVKGEREYEPRRLTLGRAGDDVWEVLAGLSEGERVVTSGNLLIDSQAQLDHPRDTTMPVAETGPPFTEAQRTDAEKLFAAAAAVGEALAADNLAAHNDRIADLHMAAMDAARAFGARGKRLDEVAHVGPADTLAEARKQFYPLSLAIANLASTARRELAAAATGLMIVECPMAKSAVPTADTNQGRWVQKSGPIRNPFFGAEMLECGTEVKP
jgi:Cu(I)/Ag(I) efflux system membrane fusion protein